MTYTQLLNLTFKVAVECHRQGRGYAQQSVVLSQVGEKLASGQHRRSDQLILTCWHDLFRMGKLSWGLDLDNPNAPFFHIPQHDPERDRYLAVQSATVA